MAIIKPYNADSKFLFGGQTFKGKVSLFVEVIVKIIPSILHV